jgi:hypothetical protein
MKATFSVGAQVRGLEHPSQLLRPWGRGQKEALRRREWRDASCST